MIEAEEQYITNCKKLIQYKTETHQKKKIRGLLECIYHPPPPQKKNPKSEI